jgi:hypothetical protein
MSIVLPLIATSIASAAVAGVAAKLITDDKYQKLKCSEDTVEYKGSCIPCEGNSRTRYYNGVQANIKGCGCAPGLGWDPNSKRCVLCPKGLYSDMRGGGGEGPIKGCGCDDDKYYDLTNNRCVDCPNHTWGNNEGDPTNIPGCYCRHGQVFNYSTNTCNNCLSTYNGNIGIKDRKCASCPTNSSTFNINGANTDVEFCNCGNGYIFENGECKQCPSGFPNFSNGKCCPSGSGYLGPGMKVSDGCYCLPFHIMENNQCIVDNTNRELLSLTANFNPIISNERLDKLILSPITSIPTVSNIGINNVDIILISSNLVPNVFIKNITVEYNTSTDSTIKTYILPNTQDIFIDNIDAVVQSADKINNTWIIKRLNIQVMNDSSIGYSRPEISIIFLSVNQATDIPSMSKLFSFELPLSSVNYLIVATVNNS